MLKEAINRILDLGEDKGTAKTLEIDGREYTNMSVQPVKEPVPVCLPVHTLTGIVYYLDTGIDEDFRKGNTFFIHVDDEQSVTLRSHIFGDFDQRIALLHALFEGCRFRFGQQYSLSDFIIALQTHFARDVEIEKILQVVGNLKDENVTQYSDDGETQAVTIKAGLAKVAEVAVPNPVTLAPYRTFLEIEQPVSPFVFRMQQQGEGHMPTCSLHEADGGKWKLTAIESIREWLKGELPEVAIIA